MLTALNGYRARAASLQNAANSLAATSSRKAPFRLAFMTDAIRAPKPELIVRQLRPGNAVIFRDYHTANRLRLARELRALCAGRGVLFLVAGDQHLARAVKADGIHWPAFLEPTREQIGGIVSAACHNEYEIDRANAAGVDAIFLSPVFSTASHPDNGFLGRDRASRLARYAQAPVIGLGGITPHNAYRLKDAGLSGIAAIGAFCP